MSSPAPSFFSAVPLAPGDPIFAVAGAFKTSTFPQKVNVSIGAYRDDQGRPWVLPVVRKAEKMVLEGGYDHEYLPMEGYAPFTKLSAELILGEGSKPLAEGRVAAVQTVSGTGAVRLAFEFFRDNLKRPVWCSKPTWANHHAIAHEAGLETREYRYYKAETRGLDIEGMLEDLENAPEGQIILLHACAHNPTGVDPSREQWKQIAEVMKRRGHFAFFDCAYQGFASGDLDADAWSVRYFVEQGFEIFCAQSYSKNFGLYGERTGCLVAVVSSPSYRATVQSELERLTRAMISNCPSHGARIVHLVLSHPELRQEWYDNLKEMSGRINAMRKIAKETLEELGAPGDWSHVVNQIGMFSYTGLNLEQCKALRDERHVYLLDSGRISVAGLNSGNVRYFAESVADVVKRYPAK
ncbi:pyridoxal phosphate-dependent transferase [Hyaloraphidium curvatum]|nr:pyridoxal phosphate-dependent transferase [Hyaloraphidium curvatum]